MKDNLKLGLILALVVVGAIIIAKSIGSSKHGVSQQSESEAGTASAPVETTSVDQPGIPPQGVAKQGAVAGATADIDRIGEIAKVSLDEALTTFQNYTEVVLKEGAKNPESLNRLLRATVTMSEIDGANDHYGSLIQVSDKYPAEFKKAVSELNVSSDTKALILETAKSVSDSMRNGDG